MHSHYYWINLHVVIDRLSGYIKVLCTTICETTKCTQGAFSVIWLFGSILVAMFWLPLGVIRYHYQYIPMQTLRNIKVATFNHRVDYPFYSQSNI